MIAVSRAGRAIFDAFFTPKPHGIGMGPPISRSSIESLGGSGRSDEIHH
jgi:C4-dicarboxylate-specific signal transduction histidine kinase